MASLSGVRRLRASVPEPGTRVWVSPPGPDLCCSVCDEPFSRVLEREARACMHALRSAAPERPRHPAACRAALRPLVLPRLRHAVVQYTWQAVPDGPLSQKRGRKVRSKRGENA